MYIFDPTRSIDLIDLWNLRLEPNPILPIPIDWFESLTHELRKVLKAEHRPVIGNPNGIMHRATVEFGRSIGRDLSEPLIKKLNKDLSKGSFIVKHWRNSIWEQHTDDQMHRDARLEVTADEQRASLAIKEDRDITSSFEALAPEFASRFGGQYSRWVNAINVSMYGSDNIATVLPFNTFDRHWPRLGMGGDRVIVGSEGWIISQRYKNRTQPLTLLTKEDAIIGSLKGLGIETKLSDPGHIAKQMLEQLGGLRGTYLLADIETLQLLNKMAGGLRRRNNDAGTIEETFERRSAPVKDWTDLISRRKQKRNLSWLKLSNFTEKNVIRLGLETNCPHCQYTNWHSLSAVDYVVTCERCLNRYDFPQAELRVQNRNWHYRVIGPFSVPDYGRGSYSALLSLRVLKNLSGSNDEMTFSTAINLQFDGIDIEVDFLAWWRNEQHGTHAPPLLVIGETKSVGKRDLLKRVDLNKLKDIGRKLPGTFIVISVLRNNFTKSEKKLLQSFVKWGRRSDDDGRPTNPVIILTAHELFLDHSINETWESLGKPYEEFTDYEYTRNLYNFADATQRIYLNLPSFHEYQEAEWRKHAERKKKIAK